jgi:hypothetical protein
MPYIKKHERRLAKENPINPGELNYALTKTALEYLANFNMNYDKINEIVGAFDLAKAEFIRRVYYPYEECKIVENGDVYPG